MNNLVNFHDFPKRCCEFQLHINEAWKGLIRVPLSQRHGIFDARIHYWVISPVCPSRVLALRQLRTDKHKTNGIIGAKWVDTMSWDKNSIWKNSTQWTKHHSFDIFHKTRHVNYCKIFGLLTRESWENDNHISKWKLDGYQVAISVFRHPHCYLSHEKGRRHFPRFICGN